MPRPLVFAASRYRTLTLVPSAGLAMVNMSICAEAMLTVDASARASACAFARRACLYVGVEHGHRGNPVDVAGRSAERAYA
jgi:hypothetical protein